MTMPADTLLIILLAALGGAALPLLGWLRAERRIRHLEMTVLAQASDQDRFEELSAALRGLALQNEQLLDAQPSLMRRSPMSPEGRSRPDAAGPITPH